MVAVATCDREMVNYVGSVGGNAVMTADTYERAFDRCAEALITLGEQISLRHCSDGSGRLLIIQAVQPMLDDASIQVVKLLGEIKDTPEDLQSHEREGLESLVFETY